MTAEQLKLSPHVLDLCHLSKGLVVVTGPTGSGKSTTLCAMIDYINKNRDDHIITIEDPIEFVHENLRCLINQREVGDHTDSFRDALMALVNDKVVEPREAYLKAVDKEGLVTLFKRANVDTSFVLKDG